MIATRMRQAAAGAIQAIVYLLYDTFTTDDSAPLASPRTCEPGPGTLTITDTGNKASTSGGSLLITSATSSLSDPRIVDVDGYRVAGKVLYTRIKCGYFQLTYSDFGGNTIRGGIFAFTSSSAYIHDTGNYVGPLTSWSGTTWYELAIIQKDVSALVAVRGGAWANWTLLYVGFHRLGVAMNPRQHLSFVVGAAAEVSEMFLRELGGIWGKSTTFAEFVENGTVTDGAAANPYTASVSEAGMLIEFEWTYASTAVLDIMVRRTDDNNCWIVRCNQVASTMTLYEKNAGTETQRSTASGLGFSAGGTQPVFVRCEGNSITYGNAAYRGAYASASFNNTATGVKLSSTIAGGVKRLHIYGLSLPVSFDPLAMASGTPPINIFLLGDSKTNASTFDNHLGFAIEDDHDIGAYCSRPDKIGRGGAGIDTIRANLTADLATRNHIPDYILINVGANDLGTQVEADWKADYLAVLDELHAKWADAKIYCMRVWIQAQPTAADTQAGWLADVVASRSSFTYLGPDERVWLEGGDDGATMTTDGVHYSVAGNAEALVQWKAAMGY